MLIWTAEKTTEPFQPPKVTPGVIRRYLERSRWMSAPCSATAMQITNDIPCLGWWIGSIQGMAVPDARCMAPGNSHSILTTKKRGQQTAFPSRCLTETAEGPLAQRESTHLAVTLLSLAAGWSDSLCFLRAIHSPGLFPGLLHSMVTLDKCLDPWGARESAQEAEPFEDTWEDFCSACSHGGSGAGAEILLQLAKPTLGVVAAWNSVVQDGSSCVPPEAASPLAPHTPKSIPDDERGCFQQWHLESWWRF